MWFIILQIFWVLDAIYPSYILDTVYYTVFSLGWYRVVHFSQDLKSITIEKDDCEGAIDDTFENSTTYSFAGKLEEIIMDRQLYKKSDLSLSDLTILMNTNRTYLSDYFCHVLNTTFYDYINLLRVKEMAVPLLKSKENYTIDSIASMSGFNSVSTFRRAFTKYMDMTPSQFRASKLSGLSYDEG